MMIISKFENVFTALFEIVYGNDLAHYLHIFVKIYISSSGNIPNRYVPSVEIGSSVIIVTQKKIVVLWMSS